MRNATFDLPEPISTADSWLAVSDLAHALESAGVGEYGDNAASICRLLGWMCNNATGEFDESPRGRSA